MLNMEKQRTLVMDFMKILFFMYFATLILLLLLAFVLFKTDASEMVCRVWLIAVYIISGLLGGFLIGKRTKSRRRRAKPTTHNGASSKPTSRSGRNAGRKDHKQDEHHQRHERETKRKNNTEDTPKKVYLPFGDRKPPKGK